MSQAPSVAFAANEDPGVGSSVTVSADATRVMRAHDPAGETDRANEIERYRHCVSLKGTTRGLEILISGTPPTAVLGARLTELLAEAPSFFAGSDARVAIDGALPSGALACLEDVATRFDLRIVELSPAIARRRRLEVPRVLRPEDVGQVSLAEGTGRVADEAIPPNVVAATPNAIAATPNAIAATPNAVAATPSAAAPSAGSAPNAIAAAASAVVVPNAAAPSAVVVPNAAAPSAAAAAPDAAADTSAAVAAVAAAVDAGPRLVIGPLRSGRIVEHPGHLIVIGDVNPGAEVRAEGSIIVLGRLRGVAHAGIGCDGGFIVALSLQPQQLRIGRMVARAGDADRPGDGAEIAYATGETIVVERFLGRLPSGLAASM
jgi:septum site-determining protein MinC